MIRPMLPDEEIAVRDIYRKAHRHWPERSRLWYFAHPTLVLVERGEVIGFTSFSVGADDAGMVLYGVDLCVLPGLQRHGYGRQLAEARVRYGRDVGCTRFLGATEPDNHAMRALLKEQGFQELPFPVPTTIFPAGEALLIGGPISR